jgi:hypothetical protein
MKDEGGSEDGLPFLHPSSFILHPSYFHHASFAVGFSPQTCSPALAAVVLWQLIARGTHQNSPMRSSAGGEARPTLFFLSGSRC